MAEWRMMSDFSIDIPDAPGILATMSTELREAGIGLVGLWGYGPAQGLARIYCVPDDPDRFRAYAEDRAIPVTEGTTFYISGADADGVLADRLNRLAAVGVSVRAIEAIRVDGRFGAFIWADAADWPRLANALDVISAEVAAPASTDSPGAGVTEARRTDTRASASDEANQ